MKFLVLGAGMQGSAGGYYLARYGNAKEVIFADLHLEAAQKAASRINQLIGRPIAKAEAIDVRNSKALVELFRKSKAVFSAVDYQFNLAITEAAIEAGTHLVDLGGNTEVVLSQLKLHEKAELKDISIIPDCGLAPGLGNSLAAFAVEQLDECDSIQVRCGGLPQNPKPPLSYKLVFSVRGLTNEYFGEAWIIRNGKREKVSTFSECEKLEFAAPVGACEAFVTTGGSSTCPWTFEGKVKNYDYKTVRYPGHYEKMKCLLDLGFLDTDPISLKSADGQLTRIAPREVFHELATQKLSFPNDKDLVVLRIEARGKKSGALMSLKYDLMDFHCEKTGFTAMERSTSYPAAQVLIEAAEGRSQKGVRPLETALNNREYLKGLLRSDLKITGLSL